MAPGVVRTTGVTTEGMGTTGSVGEAFLNSVGMATPSLRGVALTNPAGNGDAIETTPTLNSDDWVFVNAPNHSAENLSVKVTSAEVTSGGGAAGAVEPGSPRPPNLSSLQFDHLHKVHKE